jgi:outer membrane receptor protein involved in Fe transport
MRNLRAGLYERFHERARFELNMPVLLYSAAVRFVIVLPFLLGPAVALAGQAGPGLKGVVVDASGAPIGGATVTPAGGEAVRTGEDGTFQLTVTSTPAVLHASAPGFAATDSTVSDPSTTVRMVLQPAPLEDKVLVTASRGVERLGTAGSTTAVSSAELLNSGAGALDDALRGTPGFSLFRRSTSRVANPTTQGVTLRGVSGSGASRTLVLADGIPLNDPFGTWVYWNRIPQAAVERVEVVRGGTGDLYGADALGGVVQLLTFTPGQTRLRFIAEGGSQDTGRASGYGGFQRGKWFLDGAGEVVRTEGAIVVAEESRGPVDIPADSDYQSGYVGGGYNAGTWHAGLRVSMYAEDRSNGTPLQINTTDWTQVSGEAGGGLGGGAWLAHASGGTQDYFQTFSQISTAPGSPPQPRALERLTRDQRAPTTFYTGSGQWTRAWGSVVALFAGEGRYTNSTVEEFEYSQAGVPTGPVFLGGKETFGSVFTRVSFAPVDDVTIVAGARGDFWRSTPHNRDTPPGALLPEHSANFLSPRASVGWRVSDMVSIQGAVYRAHRTPSLNELHRGFFVGAIFTQPNPLLDPETLTGFDGGVLFTRSGVSARVTAFANRVENAITNVTIGTNLRQRQNTDTVRATGVEVEVDLRPHPRWAVGGLFVATSARFDESPEQPEIEGNRVPQVPPFQVGGSVSYVDPRGFTASLQARAFGPVFDDDLNLNELEKYGVVDFTVSQQVVRGLTAFFAAENVFDKEYSVSLTTTPPLRTVGWPRSLRAGIRLFLP